MTLSCHITPDVVVAELVESDLHGKADVVDEAVDLAELGLGSRDQLAGRVGPGGLPRRRATPPPRSARPPRGQGSRPRDGHPGAFRDEQPGGLRPDPRGPSR